MRCSSDPPSSRLRLLDGGIVAASCALIGLCFKGKLASAFAHTRDCMVVEWMDRKALASFVDFFSAR